jgi:hypothetical protein
LKIYTPFSLGIRKAKMPNSSQKTGAQLSKRAKQSEIARNKSVLLALDDEDAFFGRVTKINMNRATVTIWDHEKPGHYDIQATLPNKKKGFIQINDIVNVAKSSPDWEIQVAIDRKTAGQLHKAKRITDVIFNDIEASEEDANNIGFDFDYDAVPDTVDQTSSLDKTEKTTEKDDDDDFDIDRI